jgi:hypothetical protein
MTAGQAKAHRTNTPEPQEQACAAFLEEHAAWMDGVLGEAESARHEAHARLCKSCARYQRVLDRGLELVRELPEIEPSAHFEERLRHRIFHIEDAARLERKTGRSAPGLAAAAVIALIAWSPMIWRSDVSTALRAFGHGDSYDAVPAREQAPQQYAASAAEYATAADDAAFAPIQAVDVGQGRMSGQSGWYVRPAAPAIEQTPVQHLVSRAGSYSPLIVSPPAYGRGPQALRLVSATTQ